MLRKIIFGIVFVMILSMLGPPISRGGSAQTDCSEAWVARYNGPVDLNDRARAIAVDSAGNVYVTGNSFGNEILRDYATIKYDSDGYKLWEHRYNGEGNGDDYAVDIAVDSVGNVYVTGSSYVGPDSRIDIVTIKYPSTYQQGDDPEWINRYNGGPSNFNDFAYGIAVDSSGNAYVIGISASLETYWDYTTIKYDGDGNEVWVARYNGSGNHADFAQAIAVDPSGNVYITGESLGSGTGYDYATIKYDSNGIEQWVARYNGPADQHDYAEAIAVDSAGNVYVTGVSYGSETRYDYATVKYDSDGYQLWEHRYNGPANYNDYAEAIAVDSAGNVYVTGEIYGSETAFDMATIKYPTDYVEGQYPEWIACYNGPADRHDHAEAIAVDSAGNVYVTGSSLGSGTSYDYATLKYDSAGNEVCVARYNGPVDLVDAAYDIALDAAGNVYVTGDSGGIETSYDYATVKYYGASATEMIEALVNRVESFNLKQGISNSLDVKLQKVMDALNAANAGQRSDAINKLEAFKNECEAQRGNTLTSNQADQLIAHANQIIQALQQ